MTENQKKRITKLRQQGFGYAKVPQDRLVKKITNQKNRRLFTCGNGNSPHAVFSISCSIATFIRMLTVYPFPISMRSTSREITMCLASTLISS